MADRIVWIETCEVFVRENDDGMKVARFNIARSKPHDIKLNHPLKTINVIIIIIIYHRLHNNWLPPTSLTNQSPTMDRT
jgi:hypothetical protein